ncbi:MAG: hypothetical protein HUU20_18970 [Pirellulales bacterium]|nr:hypothetical protein [Pirellulales bacterium]
MTTIGRVGQFLALATFMMLVPVAVLAADGIKGFGPYRQGCETVDLFQAIEDGQLQVRLIPRDSAQVRLLVENKSGKPLNVLLPEAMAASPVLAQFENLFGPGGGQDNAPQNLGFGMPMMQGGGNQAPLFNMPGGQNQNRGPGFMPFNIAPEVVGQMKLSSVCLDHGKPNPRPTIQYELRRIDEVTAIPAMHEVCSMLGRGEIGQKAAQAAAWHLNNGLSWEELKKERIHAVFGLQSKIVFTPEQIEEAKKAVKKAEEKSGGSKNQKIASSLSASR